MYEQQLVTDSITEYSRQNCIDLQLNQPQFLTLLWLRIISGATEDQRLL